MAGWPMAKRPSSQPQAIAVKTRRNSQNVVMSQVIVRSQGSRRVPTRLSFQYARSAGHIHYEKRAITKKEPLRKKNGNSTTGIMMRGIHYSTIGVDFSSDS